MRTNGYTPRSWGDLLAVATICSMLLAVVAWGLKLEGRLEAIRQHQMELTREVANELSNAQLHTYPEDGHISTYTNHFEDIAQALLPD